MDSKFIALLRGINVGRAKRIAMADLRALVEGLGYSDVHTLLNSGNVVFTAPNDSAVSAAARIEEGLSTRLGVSAKVLVLTAVELATIVDQNPLSEDDRDPSRLLVAFLSNPESRTMLGPLLKQDWTPEVLVLGVNAAYLWCPDGILVSRMSKAVGQVLGKNTTTRNWATVRKIHGLASHGGKRRIDESLILS